MALLGSAVSALAVLAGVLMGGWLTLRNQDRQWTRDHDRQWRDIRLSTYSEFVTAYRAYVAFALEPSARVSAVPHPQRPTEWMPFFDEAGRTYKERLESAWVAVRLIAEGSDTVEASRRVLTGARQVAAARAAHRSKEIPAETFRELWAAQYQFISAVRIELGLDVLPRFEGFE